VHAHYFLVDESYKGHVVEAIVEGLPESDFVSSFDLVKEPVHPCDCLALMVSSKNNDLVWVSYFKSKEKANDFAALFSSVDVITHE